MSRIAGIAGSAAGEDGLDRLVESMLAAQVAPTARFDKKIVKAAGPASLGWRGGGEPNVAEFDGVTVVMDGVIFDGLAREGIESDAKNFARRYRQAGMEQTLIEANGDFAMVLWDSRSGEFFLARDRFGIKPLYYTVSDDRLAFASRPAGLLALPFVSRAVNKKFVGLFAGSHYRTFDNDPDASPYTGICQLPAASWLAFRDGQISRGKFWHLEDRGNLAGAEDDLAGRYRDMLIEAVRCRLARAGKPGFTLSGGMDSSSILACAVKACGVKQHAFSSVYQDKTFDESDDIRTILDAAVAKWHQIPIGIPDVFGLVRRMVRAHDEPVATATWLSHYILCKQAAGEDFGGLFGGLGGDELNAGEYEYFFFHFADLKTAGRQDDLAREIEMWVKYHDHPIYRKSRQVAEEVLARVADLKHPGACLGDRKRLDRYADAINKDFFDVRSFQPVMDGPFGSYLKNRTWQDMSRETIPCCLRAEDRNCAEFGLDNYLPFFDYRLVEFMFQIPGTLKFRMGVTKHLLRQAMRGVLPESTRTRIKKTGWNAPAHVWFSGKGMDAVRDMVGSKAFRQRGIYNLPEVQRIIDEHEQIVSTGKVAENHMMFLWQMVNLELWLEDFGLKV
ncbi:MAG: asparagine synthase [Planctomycetes bacterium]|nr:asparagine synthase [Planctomycetota bacterium]